MNVQILDLVNQKGVVTKTTSYADCSSNLYLHFNQGNPEIEFFNCSNYKSNRGTYSNTHYIRERQNCQRVEMMLEAMRKYSGVWGSA